MLIKTFILKYQKVSSCKNNLLEVSTFQYTSILHYIKNHWNKVSTKRKRVWKSSKKRSGYTFYFFVHAAIFSKDVLLFFFFFYERKYFLKFNVLIFNSVIANYAFVWEYVFKNVKEKFLIWKVCSKDYLSESQN